SRGRTPANWRAVGRLIGRGRSQAPRAGGATGTGGVEQEGCTRRGGGAGSWAHARPSPATSPIRRHSTSHAVHVGRRVRDTAFPSLAASRPSRTDRTQARSCRTQNLRKTLLLYRLSGPRAGSADG